MNLTPVQQQIVDTPGNLIVRASAGTGKTHTMVAKIATEIEHNHTHKSIAAITFTIKAAQEIKDRLTIDSSRHFIGTNMITLLRLLYISALARIEKLPQKNFNLV